jgi:hypothetical protein
MSDGKKFSKTDSNLTPEQRLEEVERKFSVILERIQAYDQVLTEFANIHSNLNFANQNYLTLESSLNEKQEFLNKSIENINSTLSNVIRNISLITNMVNEQKTLYEQSLNNLRNVCNQSTTGVDLVKTQVNNVNMDQIKIRNSYSALEKRLLDLEKYLSQKYTQLDTFSQKHDMLEKDVKLNHSLLKTQIDQILSSFQEIPQFNEWATKIHIKICNEINDKQKQFYYELDKRSQQLKDQLASDPYTAESVKKILKDEMDALAMDGKNAYIKASNAAQQIQMLEKKVENINLILKKYELSK